MLILRRFKETRLGNINESKIVEGMLQFEEQCLDDNTTFSRNSSFTVYSVNEGPKRFRIITNTCLKSSYITVITLIQTLFFL